MWGVQVPTFQTPKRIAHSFSAPPGQPERTTQHLLQLPSVGVTHELPVQHMPAAQRTVMALEHACKQGDGGRGSQARTSEPALEPRVALPHVRRLRMHAKASQQAPYPVAPPRSALAPAQTPI